MLSNFYSIYTTLIVNETDNMQTTVYLAVKEAHRGYKNYSVRATKTLPDLQSGEIAVKVTLDIPDAAFTKPQFEAKVTVPKEAVSDHIIDANVVDNVEQIIKEQTGFDVTLQAIEED